MSATPATCPAPPTEHRSRPGARVFLVSARPDPADRSPGAPMDLLAARAEVRRCLAGPGLDIEVRLADGDYHLDEPLVLSAEDSPRPGHTVTWTAGPGARPVLTGGIRLTGWQPAPDGRWTASVPEAAGTPRQLYVNGVRASLARGPWLAPESYAISAEGLTGPVAAELAGWARPTDVEAVFRVRWRNYHCRVAAASPELVTFVEPCWTNSGSGTGRTGPFWDNTCVTTTIHDRSAFLANAPELLDTPGDFVWNSADRTVSYMPRPGEYLHRAQVLVPVAEQLIVLDRAHDVELRGLAFAHTAWRQPSTDDGYAGMQAGLTLTGSSGPTDESGQFYTKPSAAVTVRGGRRVTVADCRFAQLGGAGAVLEAGTRHSTVTGCTFTDISSGAVYAGDADPHPAPELADEGNAVSHNTISGTGVEFTDSVGVWGGYTKGLTVTHNTLENLPYSGISVGWGWNQPQAQQPWLGDNSISCNRITNVLMPAVRQYDGGAIYTQGQQPGTVVSGNYIDRSQYPPVITDGNGIYLDEQSSHFTVSGNVVTRVGYKWVSNWAGYGVDNNAVGNWTDSTITPPLSGEGSRMADNLEALTELPPAAVDAAAHAGAGPWPAPVEQL